MNLEGMQKVFATWKKPDAASVRLALLNTLKPVTELIGKIRAPFSVKDVEEDECYEAQKLAKPGMVFVTRIKGQLDDLLIPGWWTHCGIVSDENHVIDATALGVTSQGLITFLLRKDYAVLLKPKFATEEQMAAAASFSVDQLGAQYDYDFLAATTTAENAAIPVKERAFYCAKLPWAAYRAACGDNVPFTTRLTLGVQTVVPADYVKAVDKWELVWASKTAKARLPQPAS